MFFEIFLIMKTLGVVTMNYITLAHIACIIIVGIIISTDSLNAVLSVSSVKYASIPDNTNKKTLVY